MNATRWLGRAATAVFALTVIAAAISLVERWPYQFGGHGSRAHMLSDFLQSGTAVAPPLFILMILGVSAVLVRRLDAWGNVGCVLLIALAALMMTASLGEALAGPAPDVPRAAQIFSGAFGGTAAIVLASLAVASIRERRAARRRAAGRRGGPGLGRGLALASAGASTARPAPHAAHP